MQCSARSLRAALLSLVLLAALTSGAARADVDGDGVPDDVDRCPTVADDQADVDGDGIGDACTCGDASGDGRVDSIDARLIQRCAVGVFACPALCDVTGEGACNSIDARLVQRAAVGLLSAAQLQCAQRPSAPAIAALADREAFSGPTLHVPLDGWAPAGGALSWAIESDTEDVTARIVGEGPWLDVEVRDFGRMRFQLFGDRVPRAVERIAGLARSGFYDGIIFHRVLDDFVIQGGDPDGNGTGGSGLGFFDDQFHPELQHTSTGLLSMAKTSDDTNDSQFFITEYAILQQDPFRTSTRHLDFNHTIFGALVEGEAVREAISGVATNAAGLPDTPVVMERVVEVDDVQNEVAVLRAPEGFAGTVRFTVTASDDQGGSAVASFDVVFAPDRFDDQPWLDEIPDLETPVGTLFTYQLGGFDVDGPNNTPGPFFLDHVQMQANGVAPPLIPPDALGYSVDFVGGLLTVDPDPGLAPGTYFAPVALGHFSSLLDVQVMVIRIVP